MQARELVEHWCVGRVLPASPDSLAALDELLGEQVRLMDDPIGFIDCDRAFHRTIVRQAANPVLAEFYESLRERQVRMGLRAVANEEDRARRVLAEHGAVVDALRAGVPGRAHDALAAHLSSTMPALRQPDGGPWAGSTPEVSTS